MLDEQEFFQQFDLLLLKDFLVVRWAEVVNVVAENRFISWHGTDDDHEDADQQECLENNCFVVNFTLT